MRVALEEARTAASYDEVPVGAVLVVAGREVARGHNRTIRDRDPSAHAEIVALRAPPLAAGDHRVGGTLYVTLEPCVMCMGALVQARIERLVFGAPRSEGRRRGVALPHRQDPRLNHRFPADGGVPAAECRRDCSAILPLAPVSRSPQLAPARRG